LHCKYFIRYMDDFIILDIDKRKLWDHYKTIKNFTSQELKLEIKNTKTILSSANKGISFLGYVIFPNKVWLRSSTIKRFYKKLKKSIKNIDDEKEKRNIINKRFKNWYSYYHIADYHCFIDKFYNSVIKKYTPSLIDKDNN
jgi:hypothetical protein